jgi:glucokinase
MKKYIGFDLGGTNLRAALVDVETGQVMRNKSIPTLAREGHEAVMQRIATLALELIAQSGLEPQDIGGIGIGVPGVLDLEKGEVVFLPNLPGRWEHVPMRQRITELTGIQTSLLNDARAITYGEWRYGAGAGADTVAVFTIGTGVGGGLIINGQLHLGIGGTAGELGHTVIDHNGPRCGCGNFGCLEAYASGPAITSQGIKAVVQGLTTSIGKMCDYDLNRITPELIANAARDGDAIATSIYEQAGFALGITAGNVCTALSPSRIIITGGVSRVGSLLLEPMKRTMLERVTTMPVEQVEVVLSTLGDNAGVAGVACWAAAHPKE